MTGQAHAEERHFDLEIHEGRIEAAPPVLQVTQGDQVTLSFLSDSDTQIHLHGYDLKLMLTGGEAADLRFEAGYSGRYPAALHAVKQGGQGGRGHDEGRALFFLEVYPK